jgi:crossover junction endodeoxyribonuclease RusA
MTTIVLIPPAEFINANQRLHHHAKAKLTKAWREAARVAALDVEPHMYDRAHVVCAIRFPTNHRRDIGNYYGTAKACLDGIVSAGQHLTDDDDSRVLGPDMRRTIPNGSPLVTITIRPLEDQ